MDYDVLAFIGRFQPFHKGHKAVVDEALRQAKRVVIVIGSCDKPRTTRNPFTGEERVEMISAVYPDEVSEGRIRFHLQVDHTYNHPRWIKDIQNAVRTIANTPFTPDPIKIGLIGHSKDQSSYYLQFFPNWGSVNVPNHEGHDATTFRKEYFDLNSSVSHDMLPREVQTYISNWDDAAFEEVCAEYEFLRRYWQQWEWAPYPPTFQTVDAIVVQSGHVLLVRRGAKPGKGLWAMPGGFLDPGETLRESMLRELREETRIDVPEKVLNGSVRSWRTFDDPNRSERGRTITTAFHIELPDRTELPAIRGGDDADKAAWVPLSQLKRSALYEDHHDIIESMLGI